MDQKFRLPYARGTFLFGPNEFPCLRCGKMRRQLFVQLVDADHVDNIIPFPSDVDSCVYCNLDAATDVEELCYNCVCYGFYDDNDCWTPCASCQPKDHLKAESLDEPETVSQQCLNQCCVKYSQSADSDADDDDEEDEDDQNNGPYEICLKILIENENRWK